LDKKEFKVPQDKTITIMVLMEFKDFLVPKESKVKKVKLDYLDKMG